MLYRILLLFCVAISLSGYTLVNAQDPSTLQGTWTGALNTGAQSLRIVFNVKVDDKGGLSSTLDSPDQGATGIPVQQTSFANGEVVMEVAVIGGSFTGILDGETIKGQWSQGGASLPLELKKSAPSEEPEKPSRPQEPERPFPYKEEVVQFDNGGAGITLEGTLTLPNGSGKHPVVVLISGSGPQDRDESLMGHRPFLVLSDYLTRQGIAVLRYDERGVGASQGTFHTATTLDFATDTRAAVQYLKTREDIDSEAIGLIGHSEGGLIAPLIASESDDVAFVVLLAGPGMPGKVVLLTQSTQMAHLSGMDNTLVERMKQVNERLYDTVADVNELELLPGRLKQELGDIRKELKAEEIQKLGLVEERDSQMINQLANPWMRQFIIYDPRPTLQRVQIPVLSLIGDKDVQVSSGLNSSAIEKALQTGGNPDYTVRKLPGLNHLFQTASTGLPTEYAQIEETFSEEAMAIIASWINERV